MKVFKNKSKLLLFLSSINNDKSIGFVPTMGALHEGHLQLISTSMQECDVTICSIFINPLQFNNNEDLNNYPFNLEDDLNKLKKIQCQYVYAPTLNDFKLCKKNHDFGLLDKYMEGAYRPGHFNGMATIVEEFFNLINPNKAYFGEKDLQQLQIVKRLVLIMKSSIKIISVSTVREKNGLAKSSRNNLLSKKAKNEASLIYQALVYCQNNKQKGIPKLKKYVIQIFKKNPIIKLEYVEFVRLEDMSPISNWEDKGKSAICIAAFVDNVRLIDNIIL